ncbi:MAG: ATP-binding protein [Halocynthiibacter sp.]
MNFKWIKPYLPRSLYGRAALILIVPIFVLQLIVGATFVRRHYAGVTGQMIDSLRPSLTRVISDLRLGAYDAATARAKDIEFTLDLSPKGTPITSRRIWDISGYTIVNRLKNAFPDVRGIDLNDDNYVVIWVNAEQGLVTLQADRWRFSPRNPHQLLVMMVFVSLVMLIVAFLYLRNQLRPIKRISKAADAFGRGEPYHLRISGATEVRAAGLAFKEMRMRIERQITERTEMLSGVSHDLRTPLTRLRLALSMADEDDDTRAMKRDVEDMQNMLDEFLAFAKGVSGEVSQEVDLKEFIEDIVDRYTRQDRPVILVKGAEAVTVKVKKMAIKRAIENLISNGLRYGAQVRVSLQCGKKTVGFLIEDDGPGISKDDISKVLQPFTRLEEARGQNHGEGVGLGLTIANDVARSHGGSLRLTRSKALGGLCAEFHLLRR